MDRLKPPHDFPFPFTPYPIQKDFMKSLYSALEDRKLGIFESPTGTGKSLSLICGALTWLTDHETRERDHQEQLLKESDETLSKADNGSQSQSWLSDQAAQLKARQAKVTAKTTLDAMSRLEAKISKFRLESKERKKVVGAAGQRLKNNHAFQSKHIHKGQEEVENTDYDDDMLLEECNMETAQMRSEAGEDRDEEIEEETFQSIKIFFCSRTHSQLTQFVNEVQMSPFANNVRLVPLASRPNYCINDTVKRLKSLALINERCLDLQKKTSYKTTAVSDNGNTLKKARKAVSPAHCPFMNHSAIELLSQDIVSEVQDVEQIVKAGKNSKTCPYYASRASIPYAQVVVIPYNTLLHKATREACGISVKDNVVIIDEAHNLLESIGGIHSAQVNGYQLSHSHCQLIQYRDKYQARFSPSTLLYLNQVIFIVAKLIRMLGGKAGCDPENQTSKSLESKIFTLAEFVISAEIDNFNIFKVLSFCKSSKISHKLHGFSKLFGEQVKIHEPTKKMDGIKAFLKGMETSHVVPSKMEEINHFPEKNEGQVALEATKDHSNNPFLVVMGFLESLTNDFSDGRILLKGGSSIGKCSLKFLLLNPAAHFQDIVRQARSVIVAGGTMEPISEFQNQLFVSAGASIDRILHFSCGHVIPPDNILPIVLGSGPSGKQFDFSYTQRETITMVKELGRLILNVCNVVPAGVVCFFPSYEYEKYVIQSLENEGIIRQIELKKKIFREPKQSSDVEETLSAYSSCIQHASKPGISKLSGAILFSVIGGKLSEGINFSDNLGRCVLVVGLPFPNVKSVELQEQMKFLNATVGEGAGQSHYENLCMKAVNQSIGRAVRHQNDYAAVLLIDHRYLQQTRQNALPKWIQRSLQSHPNFGPALRELSKFFIQRRRKAELPN